MHLFSACFLAAAAAAATLAAVDVTGTSTSDSTWPAFFQRAIFTTDHHMVWYGMVWYGMVW